MDTNDDKREAAKRRAAEHDAELLGTGAGARSALPADPSLPSDAQALRAVSLTPLERLAAHAAGHDVYDGDMSRMAADKASLPYLHRLPAARQDITISDESLTRGMTQDLLAEHRAGRLSLAELRAMRDAYDAMPDDTVH